MADVDARAKHVAQKIVNAFLLVNPEAEFPEDAAWRSIISNLPGDEARLLPRGLSAAVTTLFGLYDDDRARLAVRLAVGLEMVESIGSLLYVGRREGSVDAVLAAAILSANPAVAPEWQKEVLGVRDLLRLRPRQESLLAAVMDPFSAALSGPAEELQRLTWPGAHDRTRSPIVCIEESDATPIGGMWLVISELRAAGATVKRLMKVRDRNREALWLGPDTISAGWEPSSFLNASPPAYVRLPAELFEPKALVPALEAIGSALRDRQGTTIDLSDAPRFLTSAAPQPAGRTETNVRWGFQLDQIRRQTFSAVVSLLTDRPRVTALTYDEVDAAAREVINDEFQSMVRSELVGDARDQVGLTIRDAVAAAVRQLISEGKIEWDDQRIRLQPVDP